MKTPKRPAVEIVGVGVNLRRAYSWLEELASPVKRSAVDERRKAERDNGPWLPRQEIAALVDELEGIQRELNLLFKRRGEIIDAILAHWGHTGALELEGALGRTLISPSFELGLDEAKVREAVDSALWNRVSRRVLSPAHFLSQATTAALKDVAGKALRVRKLKVSVWPPSSRGSKSAEATGEEDAV